MIEHMIKMLTMIRDLNAAGNFFIEEQQIQAVLRALQIFGQNEAYYKAHSLSCRDFLSLKKSDKDSKLIEILMWLILITSEHLGSSAIDKTKHI